MWIQSWKNSSQDILRSKTNVLTIQKWYCSLFCNFFSNEVEVVSWKSEAKRSDCLNPKLIIERILENHLKLCLGQKRIFWTFEIGIFYYFADFWVAKLKAFSAKARQILQNSLNPNLITRSISENNFKATLKSKTTPLNVWKWHYLLFWWFLSDEVENKAKRSKLFKSKLGHSKHVRKSFWD